MMMCVAEESCVMLLRPCSLFTGHCQTSVSWLLTWTNNSQSTCINKLYIYLLQPFYMSCNCPGLKHVSATVSTTSPSLLKSNVTSGPTIHVKQMYQVAKRWCSILFIPSTQVVFSYPHQLRVFSSGGNPIRLSPFHYEFRVHTGL